MLVSTVYTNQMGMLAAAQFQPPCTARVFQHLTYLSREGLLPLVVDGVAIAAGAGAEQAGPETASDTPVQTNTNAGTCPGPSGLIAPLPPHSVSNSEPSPAHVGCTRIIPHDPNYSAPSTRRAPGLATASHLAERSCALTWGAPG